MTESTDQRKSDASAGRAVALRLAPFRFEVTPPIGHPCCGGWLAPVSVVDDSMEAIGFVLLGAGEPIVICAVDWTGLCNDAHLRWRRALAEAAGTTPDRVVVQCVHQHNAPLVCLEAEVIVRRQGDLPDVIDTAFFESCLDRGRAAVRRSLSVSRPVSQIGWGMARVEEVASNRRVYRNSVGQVVAGRSGNQVSAHLRSLPEGLIDPWLRTVAFFDHDRKIAACHYYATHPISHYGDGRATSEFPGLARKRRQADEPECLQVYFTGCAGNVGPAKYSDGTNDMRLRLTQRTYEALVTADKALHIEPVRGAAWKTAEILPPPRADLMAPELERLIADRSRAIAQRGRAAFMLSWLRRYLRQHPFVLGCLKVNRVDMLFLPGEIFVEYQLRAQALAPDRFVAIAAYGDAGFWYVPVREEYAFGGYEVRNAYADSSVDALLTDAITRLLG